MQGIDQSEASILTIDLITGREAWCELSPGSARRAQRVRVLPRPQLSGVWQLQQAGENVVNIGRKFLLF